MTFEQIAMESRDGVSTITLNRSDRLNAWTQTMERELRVALETADSNPAIRAVVITGSGRAFCAGADMDELKIAATRPEGLEAFLAFPRTNATGSEANYDHRFSYLWRLSVPVVAAINGPVAGIGLCLALFCDYRFIAASAPVFTAFAQRGLIAEHGAGWILPRLVGHAEALRLLLSPGSIDAAYADRIGLARLIEDAKLVGEVSRFATDLATRVSPRSTAIMKRQVYSSLFEDFDTSARTAEREMFLSFRSEDFAEGIAHYLEKRAPSFTGR